MFELTYLDKSHMNCNCEQFEEKYPTVLLDSQKILTLFRNTYTHAELEKISTTRNFTFVRALHAFFEHHLTHEKS